MATDLVADVTDDLSVNSVHPSSVTSIAPSATSVTPSVATSVTPSVATSVANIKHVAQSHTAFLMTEFYKNLQQNIDKGQALRLAMLTTKKRYPDPLYWAAFTLIGEVE